MESPKHKIDENESLVVWRSSTLQVIKNPEILKSIKEKLQEIDNSENSSTSSSLSLNDNNESLHVLHNEIPEIKVAPLIDA